MPKIMPITDLRNTTEVSNLCHSSDEPVFITKNGYGDMVIMSMETYDSLCGKLELYTLLNEGLKAEKDGELLDFDDAAFEIRKDL